MVAIGWDLGDLTGVTEVEVLGRIRTKRWRKRTYIQEQLLYLRDGMNIGDKIVAYSAGRVFGLGEVTSRYYYRQDDLDFPNRANVKWYVTPDILSRDLDISNSLKRKLSRRVTILPLTREEWQNIKKAISEIWFDFI